MQYRIRLAQEERQWKEAERLQRIRTDQERQQVQNHIEQELETTSAEAQFRLQQLAASLDQLGHIQREQKSADCVASYEESRKIFQQIGDKAGEAITAFNLGNAYYNVEEIRDLTKAENWYQISLDLRPQGDNWGQAICRGQLGLVAYERFKETRNADDSETALEHINKALNHYLQALNLFPAGAVNELATTHNALANIYAEVGQFSEALKHYQQALKLDEQTGNIYSAAGTRQNMAVLFAQQGQLDTALLYARAALENYKHYGERTNADRKSVV